jgi:hypothetical protein
VQWRREETGIEGVNVSIVHYMHVWKCHNEIPYFEQLLCTNKKDTILSFLRYHTIRNTTLPSIWVSLNKQVDT